MNLVTSVAHAAPDALLLLAIDAATGAVLEPYLSRHTTLKYVLVDYAGLAASLPPLLAQYTPAVARYHHYSILLAALAKGEVPPTTLHGMNLRGTPLTPPVAVLLVDARDTLVQRDPFAPLWPRLQQGEVLVVSQEPVFMPLLKSAPNTKWGRVCYGDASLALFDDATSILCSGVTMGSVKAVTMYVQAMLPALLTCSKGHGLNYDQFIHNVLLRPPHVIEAHTGDQGPVADLMRYAQQLQGIRVHTARAEGAWLCSVGYWAMVSGHAAPSLSEDGWILARHAAAASEDVLSVATAGQVCAVVHQFDRFPALKAHFQRKMDEMRIAAGVERK